MDQTRRQFMAYAAGLAGAAAGALQANAQSGASPEAGSSNAKGLPAKDAPAPKMLEAREGILKTGDAKAAEVAIWGYDGGFPGPVLRGRKGTEFALRLKNSLKQDTAIHWRGLRIPNAMDGVAGLTQPGVRPGGSFDYRFTPPDAGIFLYQAHPADGAQLAEQVHRGLSGLFIVDEDKPPEADADIVLMLADWKLDEKGQLAEPVNDPADTAGAGRIGNFLTVNGKAVPLRHAFRPGARVRIRIVNMCPARIVGLRFMGGRPLILAIDGQACSPIDPVQRTIPAAPGARFDVFLDVPREEGAIVSAVMYTWPLPGRPDEPPREIFSITAMGKAVAARPPIERFPENAGLPGKIELEKARRFDLTIETGKDPRTGAPRWNFGNARARLPGPVNKPFLNVALGRPVSIGFVNKTPFPEVMRVHGHLVRLLHPFDDGWDPYWRDSVIVPPGKTVRIAFLAENPGAWRIGSAIAAHAGAGLFHWLKIE